MFILLAGFAFSVSRSFLTERAVRQRLNKIRLGLLPAKTGSQSALDSFNQLRAAYQDAVTLGERERLESTQHYLREISITLIGMKTNAHLGTSVRQAASGFLDRALAYDQKAATTYGAMLDLPGNGHTDISLNTLKSLAKEGEVISSELNRWNDTRKTALSDNLQMISSRMQKETALNMFVLGIVTLLAGTIAYVIISKKIVGPINDTVRLATEIAGGNYGNRLSVKGSDEMSELATAFNRMTGKLEETLIGLREEVKIRRAAEEDLTKLNEDLELRVSDRTQALSKANQHLNNSMAELKVAQQQLVEVEKMASLGELVAGVAHEINTPVGIGVTIASHLKGKSDELEEAYASGKLKKSDLDEYVGATREGTTILLDNLKRAAGLIQSFKQVAVDRSSEEVRVIDLVEYVNEIVASLQPKLKRTNHKVTIEGVDGCEVSTYPGALAQVITNLIDNSLLHGFDGVDAGNIHLIVSEANDDSIEIRYVDDGVGMDAETLEKMFNPFFTTKRNQGGSGLGMHIIYNVISQSLKGTIVCTSSPNGGFEALLTLPRHVPVSPKDGRDVPVLSDVTD